VNLKSKGVLSSGTTKDKELFFQGIISWAGLDGWGQKRGIPFFSFFSFYQNMVI
jgi:hypothetical protein